MPVRFEGRNFDIFFLLVLVVAGFLLRYFSIPAYQVISADGPSYIAIAKEILVDHTAKSSIHYPPFYPFLIAVVSFFTKDFEAAGVMVSLVMGSLLVIPVFLLGKALFSRGVGYLTAAIVLIWPEFVGLSGHVLAYSTYFVTLMAGMYFLWSAHSGGRVLPAAFSGVFFAVAYLSRQEAFISMVAVCFCLGAATFYRERSLSRLKPLMVAFGIFFMLIFPYIWMVHQVMGIWTLAGKSVVTLTDCLGYYLNLTDLNRDPNFNRIGLLEIIRQYPGYFPHTSRVNFAKLIAILPDPLLFFAGVGFLLKQKEGTGLQLRAFMLGAFFPVLILLTVFLISGAYIAPYLPFLFMLSCHGIISTERIIMNMFGNRLPLLFRRTSVLTILVMLVYVAKTVYNVVPHGVLAPYTLEMDGGRYDHKQIGLMLKGLIPPGTTIMTRSGRIGFYSGLPRVDIPQSDLAMILRTAREQKVRYLIVDGLLLRLRPQLGKLLSPLVADKVAGMEIFDNPEEVMPGIYRRLVFTAAESQGVVVYEFKP